MFQPLEVCTPVPLPKTVSELVTLLYKDLSLRDRVIMSRLSENELDATVYLAMAKTIRREFGLYSHNQPLISSCMGYLGTDYDSYEDPAMVIIKELWKKTKSIHHLRLVRH